MKDTTATVLIVLIIAIAMISIVGISVYYQTTETQFEKCMEVCGEQIMDDTLETECIANCIALENCVDYNLKLENNEKQGLNHTY